MLSVFVASCSYVAPHAAAVSRRTAHANMLSYNNALGGADIAVHDVLYEEDHLLLLEQIAAVETEKSRAVHRAVESAARRAQARRARARRRCPSASTTPSCVRSTTAR